jgi:hypothetical protein
MSALGQKQTSPITVAMSALRPKADIAEHGRQVRFVPKADILRCGRDTGAYAVTPSLVIGMNALAIGS